MQVGGGRRREHVLGADDRGERRAQLLHTTSPSSSSSVGWRPTALATSADARLSAAMCASTTLAPRRSPTAATASAVYPRRRCDGTVAYDTSARSAPTF